jgi:2-C-methyl-D-erythritol 4-phosphate cytidylyltransferase
MYALVPAAGAGSRAGKELPKQYVSLGQRAMLAHTLQALASVTRLTATLVVLAPEDPYFERLVPRFDGARAWVARCGGPTRAASVSNGLQVLRSRGAADADWVLVHDAARCLLRSEWVERLIDAAGADAVGGLLAIPLADTLKVDRDGRVAGTLDRRDKWAAQTPQMFRIGLLEQALRNAGMDVTDESSAVESLGHAPLLIPGAFDNFKVTYPADFELAERLLGARGGEGGGG